MKILEKLKNSRIVAFFRTLRGQKALPEGEKILEEENNIVEKSSHEKFVEEVKKDANDISRMTYSETIIKLLRDLGVKEEILKNEDAEDQILKLAKSHIEDIAYSINDRNVEEVKTKLSEIVKEGRIEKVEETITENSIDSKTITIDVDENGRLNTGKKIKKEQNVEEFRKMISDGKNEEEALKESGYESKIIYESTIVECGVEMEKKYETIENVHSKLKAKDRSARITRNKDLVTASVEIEDVLNNRVRRTESRWANIYYGKSEMFLTMISEEEIDEILDKNSDFVGILPKSEEEKNILIGNKQEKIKNSTNFSKLFKKMDSKIVNNEKEF